MSDPPRRVRIRVEGRVQGVGFRYATESKAGELEVRGWVRNRPDGSVEIVAEAPPAAIDALVDWCRRGPRSARVVGVEVAEEPRAESLVGFSITG